MEWMGRKAFRDVMIIAWVVDKMLCDDDDAKSNGNS